MTEPAPSPDDIRDVEVAPGLVVRARRPTEGQWMAVTKSAAAARRDLAGNAINAIDIVFRVVTKLLVDEEDVARLDDALIDGTIGVADLMKIFGDDEEERVAAKTAKARVSRRTPRKAA